MFCAMCVLLLNALQQIKVDLRS